ncbi:MAG: thrombospondin type 3 repeat-containing protein, partial [Nitrospinota bacterium]
EDFLGDGEEVLFYKTSPLLKDSDGDGYLDGFEVLKGADPLDPCSFPPGEEAHRLPGPHTQCRPRPAPQAPRRFVPKPAAPAKPPQAEKPPARAPAGGSALPAPPASVR